MHIPLALMEDLTITLRYHACPGDPTPDGHLFIAVSVAQLYLRALTDRFDLMSGDGSSSRSEQGMISSHVTDFVRVLLVVGGFRSRPQTALSNASYPLRAILEAFILQSRRIS